MERELDACDVSFDIPDKNTSDADIAALALYADIDFTDRAAVTRRKAEWRKLFGDPA